MSRLHLANTYFEEEMDKGLFSSSYTAILQNPIHHKLQWLPFLYANSEDQVIVTSPPPTSLFSSFPSFQTPEPLLFSENIPKKPLVLWGSSPSAISWAKKHNLSDFFPSWDVVCHVNSKEFSYTNSPKLPGSALLYTFEEVSSWLSKQNGYSVLKTCFGLSGRGHLHLPEQNGRLFSFLEQEFKKNRPVIAEPWVNRILDFSTQWEILPLREINYLGTTICVNDPKGRYKETIIGDFQFPLGFEEHLRAAKNILSKMATLGYFGNVGFDAMVYENEKGQHALHPVVEINARKTMGWVALKIRNRHFPHQNINISFCLNKKEFAVILKTQSANFR